MGGLTSHGACGRSWRQRGNRTGHCAQCHETFEGISLFDWHQVVQANGSVKCRHFSDPAWIEAGLRLVDGTWRGAEMSDAAVARMRAVAA